jgi:transposase
MTDRRKRREYTEEFKRQMVALYNSGKSQSLIAKEYELTPSSLRKWIERINKTGSTHEKDNRTPVEEELLLLRKENKQLKMEVDVLKQAALILGQR